MASQNQTDPADDGIDRRGFLKCMAWTGTGVVWKVCGGRLTSSVLGADVIPADAARADFTFAQISDSHIGFSKEPNKDVTATLQRAIARLNALPARPDLLIHTGDLTHLAKASEFDTVDEALKSAKTGKIFYVPGEHDVFTDEGKLFRERFGRQTLGAGWHSFDHKGVHFVGLVNVANLKPGGLGSLGTEQLEWLKKDLTSVTSSTPVVVYAHVPLWTVYAKWGWGTDDSEQALQLLRRFGSVTVLNGHIHQVLQKTEGNITFHTARSTAFPQPAPGAAESPGPMKALPADQLSRMLGLTSVKCSIAGNDLAVVDQALE
jgi:3',5'-cyclic-AMP phosphodiesterase